MLGSSETPRENKQVSADTTNVNVIEAALEHYKHPYAISTKQQIFDVIKYLEDRCCGKVKTPKGIKKRYDTLKKQMNFLRKVVHMQGYMHELAMQHNWREEACVKVVMQAANDHDDRQRHQ